MNGKNEHEISIMYSKGVEVCKACGVKGHISDRCWTIVGYSKWHSRLKNHGGNIGDVRSRD